MHLHLQKGAPADISLRISAEQATYKLLETLNINFDRVDHQAAFTMEACEEIDKVLAPAVICKNLFLSNSQKTIFYLLMIRGDKRFKTKEISNQINSARLSFAPKELLEPFLGLKAGSVSVLGLMNDTDNKIQLLVDKDIINSEYIGCHPCTNTSSLRIKTQDIFKVFLPAVNHKYIEVELV